MDFYVNEGTAWPRKTVRRVVNVVLVLACARLLVYSSCTQMPISGGSMQPVLDADDVAPVNRLIYDVGKPKRYDIMVLECENHKENVKWIIGLPGETVQVKGGYISIDDKLLNAEDGLEQMFLAGGANTPIKLEDNKHPLLGDNRDSSKDSRLPNIGSVEREQIQGKVWFRMFPLLKLDSIHPRQNRSLQIRTFSGILVI